MRICALSDTHGELPKLPEDVNFYVHAGDICPDFSHEKGFRQAIWMNNHIRDWMPRNFYFTWGNHDWVGEDRDGLLDEKIKERVVVDSVKVLAGVKVWFSPWSNYFGRWAFMKHPEDLLYHYSAIPEGVDVVVSHQPPKDYRGMVDGVDVGSIQLLHAIRRVKPRVVICGHIHEGFGSSIIRHEDGSETTVFNVAMMDGRMRFTNPPTIIQM